jgi:hypothetical protein
MPLELSPRDLVVRIKELAPGAVTERGDALVEPTMSVRRTVARTRSISGTGRTPVRNASTSPRIASLSPTKMS